jgi:4-oxalocrotonate tautomerase
MGVDGLDVRVGESQGQTLEFVFDESLDCIHLTQEGNMPLVTIHVTEGRTTEQKRGMVKDVTDAIVKNIGCPVSAVRIAIVDLKLENAADGGVLLFDSRKK